MLDEMKTKDPYEDQLSAARFKAERDVARQEIDRMRPAFEWVEEHGGLEKIRRQRRESIPRAAYERKRGNLLKHIAGCEKALGKRNKRVKELEKEAKGLRERVNRPAPKVLDVDGVEIRVGETVYKLEDSRPYTVKRIDGDHVYINAGGSSFDIWTFPWALTHERPDSWERLEGDCAKSDVDYCAERGLLDPSCDTVEGDGSTRHCTDCGCTCGEKMARDLVRRAKALAERGQ